MRIKKINLWKYWSQDYDLRDVQVFNLVVDLREPMVSVILFNVGFHLYI